MRSVFAAFALSDNNKKQSMIKLSGNDQKHLDVYHSLHIITKNHNDMSEDGYQSISCTKIVLEPMPWPRCFFFLYLTKNRRHHRSEFPPLSLVIT